MHTHPFLYGAAGVMAVVGVILLLICVFTPDD
jgi:hypothetical protein